MKKVLFITILALTIFSNCKKDSDSGGGSSGTIKKDVPAGEATTVTGDVSGVGTVTVDFDENSIAGTLALEIKKADSISSEYTAHTIEEAGVAVSILPADAATVTLTGDFEVTLPLTLAVTALLDIGKTSENLAVLYNSGDVNKIIYPVTLSADTKYVSFSAIAFGTFQPIAIEKADALTARNAQTSLKIVSSFTEDTSNYLNSPEKYHNFNNTLIFYAYDSTNGKELWKWDGTEANPPAIVKDIYPGTDSSYHNPYGALDWFTTIGTKVVFMADDGTNGIEPWVSDGTTATLLKDINTAGYSFPTESFEFNGKLYFAAEDGSSISIWSYDGTTTEAALTNLPSSFPSAAFSSPAVFNSTLHYAADEGANSYIYSFDGTTAIKVVDINSSFTDLDIKHLVVYNSKLYFFGCDAGDDCELWSYDGTTSAKVSDVTTDASYTNRETDAAFVFNGKLLFYYGLKSNSAMDLWSYTEGGTPTVVFEKGYTANDYAILGGKLYFTVSDSTYGEEPWVYDGVNPPQMIKDIYSGSDSGIGQQPAGYTVFNSKIYFTGNDATNGYQIWELTP